MWYMYLRKSKEDEADLLLESAPIMVGAEAVEIGRSEIKVYGGIIGGYEGQA